MFDPITVICVIALYMVMLFLIARGAEKRAAVDRSKPHGPVVYALSMAIYCSAWTYYGSVGSAANSGFLFFSTYLGPTLSATIWWIVLRKLILIKNVYRITSIADLISARYNNSQVLGAMATFIAFTGIVPYIALQFRAIDSTFALITASATTAESLIGRHCGLMAATMITAFTIIMGIRRLDPTERHPGIIMALSVECVVKLVGFLVVGIFVTYFMYDGISDILSRTAFNGMEQLVSEEAGGHMSSQLLGTYTLLAMSAIMFLPRQFHVAVVENHNVDHVRVAMWLVPLYMFLIALFIFPMALAGLMTGYSKFKADTFVLQLPMGQGQRWLSMLVFLGGFSAATGMIMVSSMTMATMLTNHLLLPALAWVEALGFLRRHLLGCRWVMVGAFVGLGYWSQSYLAGTYMLENFGIMSFAAVLQFAPCVLGGIFWRRGNETGARWGLGSGFMAWAYTMFVPALAQSGWIPSTILTQGPFGLTFLRPEHLFGIESMHSVTHAVFWSLMLNVSLYVTGSLLGRPGPEERRLADEFVSISAAPSRQGPRRPMDAHIDLALKRHMIENVFREYFGYPRVKDLTEDYINAAGLKERPGISIIELADLKGKVEKILTGSIGAPQAHKAVRDHFVFTAQEERELSLAYSEILAGLRLTPEELENKIDYYEARERLLKQYTTELEEMVTQRTKDLQVAQQKLMKQEKLSVLGQLTAFVSHELRNPLGVIRSSVYILRRRFQDRDPKTEKHLERIENEVSRCDSIVEELLDFTRGRRIVAVPGDLNLWLGEVLEQITPPPRIIVSEHLAPGLPPVNFDKKKMGSVVHNLITNSFQALVAKMEARNGTEDSFLPSVEVRTMRQGDCLRLEVNDNGTGMSEDILQRAFEPLFTSRARGTGLGLPIVAQIAEAHGGSVSLTSVPNQGTTVVFQMPIARDDHDV